MLKTQKSFNSLECGICKYYACSYKENYEQLYKAGFKIPIGDCPRLHDLKYGKREARK